MNKNLQGYGDTSNQWVLCSLWNSLSLDAVGWAAGQGRDLERIHEGDLD